MKKKALMVLISLFMLSILAGCSNEKVNEKLNELLFVNKIISYIEIEETDKVEEEKTDVVSVVNESKEEEDIEDGN